MSAVVALLPHTTLCDELEALFLSDGEFGHLSLQELCIEAEKMNMPLLDFKYWVVVTRWNIY